MSQQAMDVDDFLAHYGVKGMKWGVRRQKRLDRLNRVASGTANKRDQARVALTEVSARNIARAGGYKNAVKNKAKFLEEKKQRTNKGEASVKDVLALYGSDTIPGFFVNDKRLNKQ